MGLLPRFAKGRAPELMTSRYKITDLGVLEGDVLLFGGAYSNLHATQALLGQTAHIPKRNRICTGDSVGYCADPVATPLALKHEVGLLVAGNCELQLASDAPDCGCGFGEGSSCELASRAWYPFAQSMLARSPEAGLVDWFAGRPDIGLFQHHGKRYAVIHGGVSDVSRFIWPSDADEVFAQEFALIDEVAKGVDGVIAGHCGIAFERRIGGRVWINAGVIGMPPHDGLAMTRYAVLSDDGVRFHSLSYNFEAAAQAMEQTGLTQGYEGSLRNGIWPSEEILPKALRV